MEKELEVITIDGNDYFIIKEVQHKDISFLYLVNVNDEEDTMIRKTDKKDKDLIVPLEDDKEFEMACNLLLKYTMI